MQKSLSLFVICKGVVYISLVFFNVFVFILILLTNKLSSFSNDAMLGEESAAARKPDRHGEPR